MTQADAAPAEADDEEPLCSRCGAVLDVHRALAQDAPLLSRRREKEKPGEGGRATSWGP